MNALNDLAEMAVGQMLAGRIPVSSIDPDSVPEPLDEIVRMFQKECSLEEITAAVGFYSVQACLNAEEATQDIPVDLIQMLDRASLRADIGRELRPLVKKLEAGEEVDVARVIYNIGKLEKGEKVFVTLDKVEPAKDAWRPTYWPVIDDYLGGVPEASLTVIGGPPGTGKTSLLGKMMIQAAKAGKEVAFLSLEMTLSLLMMRLLEINKLTKKVRKNIHASDGVFRPSEVYAHVSRLAANHDLHFVGVDFADMLKSEKGRDGVARIDNIYNTMADLAKEIDTPVVVLSQLNEGYVGGRPRVNHLRGSRLIEALGALVLLIYNPNQIDVDQGEDSVLKWYPDTAYLIAGKSRYGFHDGSGIGAIRVAWDGESGWGDRGEAWLPLGVG